MLLVTKVTLLFTIVTLYQLPNDSLISLNIKFRIKSKVNDVPRFLAVMNPFRYKQYMNSGKVLTLTVVYCLSIVVMPSVATEHYSNSESFINNSFIKYSLNL